MAVVLLEHSTNPRHMLNGKLEHDQLHGRLGHLVVLIQVAGREGEGEYQLKWHEY